VVGERADDGTIQVAGGEVRAITQVGNKVVLGGTFTSVGPARRGSAGVVTLLNGAGDFGASIPDVDGAVFASLPDGTGGWWLAGNFERVGGVSRTNLAHVLADGSVDTAFAPTINGVVRDMVVREDSIYTVGAFTTVNGVSAQRVARLDMTGALVWGGGANNAVYSIDLDSSSTAIFIGGDFTSYAGNSSFKRLARLDAATGALVTTFTPGTVNLTVRDIQVGNAGVWIAGDFTQVGGVGRQRVALVNAATGVLGSFSASINDRVNSLTLDASQSTVYLAGRFSKIANISRSGFVGLNTSTSAATTSALALTGEVTAVALDGAGGAFIGGTFVISPEKTMPRSLARVSLSSSAVSSVVPSMSLPLSLARPAKESSGIKSLQVVGSSLMVAGDFSDYGTITRPYLVAYDVTTKALELGFDAQLNGAVRALDGSIDGASVFAGGDFTASGATPATRIAKLSMATGAPIAGFDLSLDSYAKEIVVHPDGNRVFIGGNFRFVNGVNAERFVAVNAGTGQPLPGYLIDFTEQTNAASEGGVRAMALNSAGTRLAVVGNFYKVEGQERPLVAMLDVTDAASGSVTSWSTDHYTQPCTGGRVGWMRDVAFSIDGSRLYTVSSGHFYYPACDSVNSFDATANGPVDALWTARPGDTIETVAVTSDAVYIGGHFRFLDWEQKTNPRFQVGALNPNTGEPLSWQPNANGFRGILVMESEPVGLLFGGDTSAVGGVPHGGFAQFSWPTSAVYLRRSANRLLMLSGGDTSTVTLQVTNSSASTFNLSSLTDTVSGNVNGMGTCVTPAVVPAGGTWSCQFAQSVPAAVASSYTTARTTAAGTADSVARSLVDQTTYRSVQSYPAPFIRTVLAPNTVPFPGGSPLFSSTVANESELVPMTIIALSSALHGDLNGAGTCSLPQVVQPRKMYQCQYYGAIAGPIGTSVSNTITATIGQNGATLTVSHSSSTSISRPADGGQILMVVRQVSPLLDADTSLRSRFQNLGFTVVLVDDGVAMPADVEGKVLVYLSGTVVDTQLQTRLSGVTVPVIVGTSLMYDEMDLTTDAGTTDATAATVVDPLHILNSPVVGSTGVYTEARPMSWGTPATAADVVLTMVTPGGVKPVEFLYQPGDLLVDGNPAPGCRLGLPAERTSTGKWTTAMINRFNRAVWLSVYGCGVGIISTVAGTGVNAAGPVGGIATVTAIKDPFGVLADEDGGFYYVDYVDNRVRHVDAAGVVTDVAGTGVKGFSGDGGQATSAMLNNPTRIRRDPAGRLVIVDAGNSRIRRIEASGLIVTIAGNGTRGYAGDNGPATSARLNWPHDVAWNAAGEMFIADRSNNRVRKVATSGVITTVAGTGSAGYNGDEIAAQSAQLAAPYGVAVQADGTVLIADFDNNRIRAIDVAGMIHTVAGTGVATAAGDGGPAIQADVHKPICVVNAHGSGFFVCDYNNNRVRLVDGDGVISTIIGVGTSGFSGDGDLAVYSRGNRFGDITITPSGDLLVVDRLNRRIRLVKQ